jgi:uncharacterized protein YqgV (UPF0045/DUF77 family)
MLRAEFAIYPFLEGETPPAHVQAAIAELRGAGFEVEVGPLGQVVTGDPPALLEALRAAEVAAVGAGATKMVLSIEVQD